MVGKVLAEGVPSLPERFHIEPEFQLLVACSWIGAKSLEQSRIETIVALCNKNINWDAFVSLVRSHGVPSLVYPSINQHAGLIIPLRIREVLQEINSQGRMQALFQAAEMVRLIKLFDEQNIKLLTLKGVFLSHQLYGDLGMRHSGDLDFMVKPEDFERADQILAAAGYNCYFYGYKLTARRKQYVRCHIHHFEYEHVKSGLHVELHWNTGSWLPERMVELWNHTRQQDWHHTSVTCLDDDALLLYLSDHGARHEWSCLKWLSDVARLLATDRINNWDSLFVLARQLDLQRVLAHSVLLAHWVYGVPLSTELNTLVQEEKLAAIMSRNTMAKMLRHSEEYSISGKIKDNWRMRQLRPSLPFSLQLKSLFSTHADWQVLPLPDSLFWLYYPLRPVLWFWRKFLKR